MLGAQRTTVAYGPTKDQATWRSVDVVEELLRRVPVPRTSGAGE